MPANATPSPYTPRHTRRRATCLAAQRTRPAHSPLCVSPAPVFPALLRSRVGTAVENAKEGALFFNERRPARPERPYTTHFQAHLPALRRACACGGCGVRVCVGVVGVSVWLGGVWRAATARGVVVW